MDLPELDRIMDDDDDQKLVTECLEEQEFVELPDTMEESAGSRSEEPEDTPEELVPPELMFPEGVEDEDEG